MIKFKPTPKSKRIIELLLQAGANECMFVGGFVRDILLGVESKDIDIEVYGLDYDQIVNALGPHFRVDLVGQSFGVVKVDNAIDIGIPRRESKSGTGHTGFIVESDSNLTPKEAFGRRDFTINAIGLRLDGSLCDPYDGQKDIQRKLLRATTAAFAEDPLRVLRGMQFAARFGFDTDPQTIELCRSLLPEFKTLAPERLWGEWFKWATKGQYPSKGLQFLKDTGWVEKFPELAHLIGCQQHPAAHCEGDAFEHTKLVCNEIYEFLEDEEHNNTPWTQQERLVLMFAALCHDFGKAKTTIRNGLGIWTSPGHAVPGGPLAVSFLERMKTPNWVIEQVVPLVVEHMSHAVVICDSYPAESLVRRLAVRLVPASIRMWTALCDADRMGCGGLRDQPSRVSHWLEVAQRLGIADEEPKPILQGRDLIALGMEPGPDMGQFLKKAFQAQLNGDFLNLEDAIEWAKFYAWKTGLLIHS